MSILFRSGDREEIDQRLEHIQKQAYLIFEHSQQSQALEQEKMRRQAYISFQGKVEQDFQVLEQGYLDGLQKIRFLVVASPEAIKQIVNEHLKRLENRLNLIQKIDWEIEELEKIHQGKFTIPFIYEYLNNLRLRLSCELHKIKIESTRLIENLIINYYISPFKDEAEILLQRLDVDPNQIFLKEANGENLLSLEFRKELEDLKFLISQIDYN